MTRVRTAVLISGRGSNMAALVEAAKAPDYPAEIVLVISNRPEAGGLGIAAEHGIATEAIDHTEFDSRAAFEARVQEALDRHDIALVCLAGFMRILTEEFIARWNNAMINIHPSLLPAFKGLDTHQRVLDAGVRITGCSVHVVRPEMDTGPVIAQAAVPVVSDDDARTLAARVLEAEHRLYAYALELFASGRARVSGERIVIEDEPGAASALFSPPFPRPDQ